MPPKKKTTKKDDLQKAFVEFHKTLEKAKKMKSKLLKDMQTALDKQKIKNLKQSSKLK